MKYFKTRSNASNNIEHIAFVIVYDNYKKNLDLLAESEAERNCWIRALNYFIIVSKKPRQSLDPKDLFQKADKSGNKNIDLNELDSFLTSINLKVKSDELKKLLKVKIKFSYFVSYKIVIFIFYLK